MNAALQSWVESLSSWNLKYDEFPEVLVLGCSVLLGVGKHTSELVFPSEEEALKGHAVLVEAMKRRADSFWGVR